MFTDEQIRQVDDESISEEDVGLVVTAAELMQNARAIGGEDLQRIVDDVVKRRAAKENSDNSLRSLLDEDVSVDSLPQEKQEAISTALSRRVSPVIMDALLPIFWVKARLDRLPTWSADGSKLAFIRWDMARGKLQLVAVDIATEQSRVLFDEDSIAGISWTRVGKAVVAVASRNLAYKGVSRTRNWPEFITAPSYPEIWLIEPR